MIAPDYPEAPPAPLRLRLDAQALGDNWRALDQMAATARTGAAVKADGYGLGAGQVVPVLARAGCRDWFVAHWAEVPAVIAHVPPETVAVLHGPIDHADVAWARSTGVRPVLNSLPQVARWLAGGGGVCHVMVDSGINRLGLAMADLADPLLAQLDIDLLISHLASADEDVAQNAQQLAQFKLAQTMIPARRYSLANSAGIALGPDYHADLTRPGIALYGGVARRELAGVVRQVAHPEAAVLQVRNLHAGDQVGYNATFVAPHAMRLGVVALGYADGYLRCWSNRGVLRAGAAPLPVVGRVSMDLSAIDLSAAPDVREGDWLTVDYDLPHAAAASGLSQYELLTGLHRRFARIVT
ncbi:alanine racemase [Novosphingobium sp.]|uniref:alanine racemase n=1 Tax=Novosphingobium sp. TaxID=1874826 RepID=UPI00333E5ECF